MWLFLEFLLIYLVFLISSVEYSEARCSGSKRVSYTCYKPQKWKTTHYRRCGWLFRRRCIRFVTYYNKNIKSTCYKYQSCPTVVSNFFHGGWSSWGAWRGGQCSGTCRKCGSMQYPHRRYSRYRRCNSPTPSNGGRYCSGSPYQYKYAYCNTNYCKVNGEWSSWNSLGKWTKCSAACKPCGSSQDPYQTRRFYRKCNNPKPACNGRSCNGSKTSTKSKSCNTQYCKVNGGWSRWKPLGKFENCSPACKPCGSASNTSQTRRVYRRKCNNPKPACNGRSCSGSQYFTVSTTCKTQYCNEFDEWSNWTPSGKWGKCSATCKECGSSSDPIQTRLFYRCKNSKLPCEGSSCSALQKETKSKSCNTAYCKVNGEWSSWNSLGKWTKCSAECKPCGSSQDPYQTRRFYRKCNNPKPACNGRSCNGSETSNKSKSCNTQYCKGCECTPLAMTYACNILKRTGITLASYHHSGKKDNAYAKDNIKDICDGRRAYISSYSENQNGDICKAPGGSVCLSPLLLIFINDIASRSKGKVTVNEVAGGCHTTNSWHYKGGAVDIRKWDITKSKADEIVKSCLNCGGTLEGTDHERHIHCAMKKWNTTISDALNKLDKVQRNSGQISCASVNSLLSFN